jgi:hypothetical protein
VKRILSLGAGVQSSTLALMAAYGEIEPIEAAVFADTQAEPASVTAWLEVLRGLVDASPHPFPIYTVTGGSLEKVSVTLRTSRKTGYQYVRAMIPAFVAKPTGGKGLLARRCTAEYKIRPLLAFSRKIAKVPRGCTEIMFHTLIGISYDEVQRMKPARVPWTENIWPLIDMKFTREDCLRWMESKGFPRPPRSSCVFCPFHSDAEWLRLKTEEPVEFQRSVQFERDMQAALRQATGAAKLQGDAFLHSSLKPLDQVEFGDQKGHIQIDMFGNECEGLCGV